MMAERKVGGSALPAVRGILKDPKAIRILVAEKTGFCFGVQRAYNLALSATEVKGGPLYSLGPLIHNPQVVGFLEGKGLRVISGPNELSEGDRVVVRSHGVSPKIFEQLKERGAQIIDATCPFVKKAQEKLTQLEKEGYQVVLLGDHAHAEVQTLLGYAKSKVKVINGPSDLTSLHVGKRVGLVSQTTQRKIVLQEVADLLISEVDELRIFNTICDFTAKRLEVALQMAKEVDLLLVVGGRNSANTCRLTEACHEILPDTYHIEDPSEIHLAWVKNKSQIGVTAGASTPEWVISEVLGRIQEVVFEREKRKPAMVFLTS